MFKLITAYEHEIISVIQKITDNKILEIFFKLVTQLGEEYFIVASIPIIWQLMSGRFSFKFTTYLIFSILLNILIKDFTQRDRPFVNFPYLQLYQASGYSFPSGHSQYSFIFWGLLAYEFQKKWFSCVALCLIVLIGFSRVQLGVHFPSDVLGGWLMGALTLYVYHRTNHSYEWIYEKYLIKYTLVITLMSLGLNLCYSTDKVISLCGAYLGILTGLAIAKKYIPITNFYYFKLKNKPLIFLTTLISVVGSLLIYFAFKLVSPWLGNYIKRELVILVKYFSIGTWISGVAMKITNYIIEKKPITLHQN